MNVYARFVSMGAWRDYALTILKVEPCFLSIALLWKRPSLPLKNNRSKGSIFIILRDRRKLLKTAGRIEAILHPLKTMPQLVHG